MDLLKLESALHVPDFNVYCGNDCLTLYMWSKKYFLNLDQTHFLSMDTVWGSRSMYTSICQLEGLYCAVCSSSQYCRQIRVAQTETSCIQKNNLICVNVTFQAAWHKCFEVVTCSEIVSTVYKALTLNLCTSFKVKDLL